jgi:hypothetical protein
LPAATVRARRNQRLLFFNASASWADGGKPGPLWGEQQRSAIIRYMQNGGGVAANHKRRPPARWQWTPVPTINVLAGDNEYGHG